MFCKSLRSSFAYKMLISCRWSDSPPRRLFPEIIKATEEWRTHTGALEELHDRPARSPNSPPFLHAVRQIGKHCLKSLSIRCEWWMASGQKVVDINRSAINLSKGNQLTRCQSLLHLTIFIIWIKRQNTIMINCRGWYLSQDLIELSLKRNIIRLGIEVFIYYIPSFKQLFVSAISW